MDIQALIKLNDNKKDLRQVIFHLRSLAKPQTDKASPKYCNELADKMEALEEIIEDVLK